MNLRRMIIFLLCASVICCETFLFAVQKQPVKPAQAKNPDKTTAQKSNPSQASKADEDSFSELLRLTTRNPHLEARLSVSRILRRLRLDVKDLKSGKGWEITPSSSAIYIPRSADYVYVLEDPNAHGTLVYEQPEYRGVAIYDQLGKQVTKLVFYSPIHFVQSQDGRFVVLAGTVITAYSPRGEKLWENAELPVVRVEMIPSEAVRITELDATGSKRTSTALDLATGKMRASFTGLLAENPAILFVTAERKRLGLVERKEGTPPHWSFTIRSLPDLQPSGWNREFPCNPIVANLRGDQLAMLFTCVKKTPRGYEFPNRVALFDAQGREILSRELGELKSPTGVFALEWEKPGTVDIIFDNQTRSVNVAGSKDGEVKP